VNVEQVNHFSPINENKLLEGVLGRGDAESLVVKYPECEAEQYMFF
jgi:hypothetical protein